MRSSSAPFKENESETLVRLPRTDHSPGYPRPQPTELGLMGTGQSWSLDKQLCSDPILDTVFVSFCLGFSFFFLKYSLIFVAFYIK
jgi:hypothetical protein